ncbi:MAG: hypothetical protein WCP81_00270 [Actinomycetes bacterium]
MKRAILVSAGTIAGLAAVLSYSGAEATVASADTSSTGGASAGLGGPAPMTSDAAPAPGDSAAAPAPGDSAAAPVPSDSAAVPQASAPAPAASTPAPSASTSKAPSVAPSAAPSSATPKPSASTSVKPTPKPTKTAVPAPTPSKSTAKPTPTPTVAAFKDYLGAVVPDASYGNMQVGIRVQNGKIIDAWAAQYPKSDPTSARINTKAVPTLRTETIGTTKAQIATVAGATLSSTAWIESLQSAMTAAGL